MLIDSIVKSYSNTELWPSWLDSCKITSLWRHFLVRMSLPILKYSYAREPKRQDDIPESDVIVSLTSFPARINTVIYSIFSLARQTIKPKKIILWLSKEQFKTKSDLPNSLIDLEQNGQLDIRLVDGDIKSHKKYYYAFKEYQNDYVMLADDDIFYPKNALENLMKDMDDSSVHCSYGRLLTYDNDRQLIPYNSWQYTPDTYYGPDFFFGSGGGTLLKPASLYKDVCNQELFMSFCPKADDIWLNAMSRLAGLKVSRVRTGLIFPLITESDEKLASFNLSQNFNDTQIRNVNDYYLKTLGKHAL